MQSGRRKKSANLKTVHFKSLSEGKKRIRCKERWYCPHGRVGRPWTHLLPQEHQNDNVYKETIDDKDQKTSRKDLLQLKI